MVGIQKHQQEKCLKVEKEKFYFIGWNEFKNNTTLSVIFITNLIKNVKVPFH